MATKCPVKTAREIRSGALHDLRKVSYVELFHRILLATLLQTTEVQHIVDEAGQSFAFGDDDVQIVVFLCGRLDPAFAQQFGVHADGGQRCLELVGDIGDEARLTTSVNQVAIRLPKQE